MTPTQNMKTYEILIKCFTTVVVTAEDREQALELASDVVSTPGMDLDEMKIEGELKSEHEIERAIIHSEYHRRDFRKTPYEAVEGR